MEVSEASVLRSTSVSSMRRIMAPPLRRAESQLKMKVRALPMCKKTVGGGGGGGLRKGDASITRVAKGLGDASGRSAWLKRGRFRGRNASSPSGAKDAPGKSRSSDWSV